jgi:hypothetical protein
MLQNRREAACPKQRELSLPRMCVNRVTDMLHLCKLARAIPSGRRQPVFRTTALKQAGKLISRRFAEGERSAGRSSG